MDDCDFESMMPAKKLGGKYCAPAPSDATKDKVTNWLLSQKDEMGGGSEGGTGMEVEN